jgi:hypothetical protein
MVNQQLTGAWYTSIKLEHSTPANQHGTLTTKWSMVLQKKWENGTLTTSGTHDTPETN